MFLFDDLLLRSLGMSIKPFDLLWYLELMKDYALKQKYNLKGINNQIKENRLLFEIGEISKDEWEVEHLLLLKDKKRAEEAMENLSQDIRIQEGM